MNRTAVATVLTAHAWEETFVSFARESAAVRIVARAYEPSDVTRHSPEVVLAGSETSWIGPSHVKAWRRAGIRIVGLHPPGDQPGRSLFERAGADTVLPETTPVLALLRTIRALSVLDRQIAPEGALIAVTGPRGAPGRTEIALALAWESARERRTLLVDLDPPSLGIRLGLGPHPTLSDAFNVVRTTGDLPPLNRVGPVSVLAGLEGGPLAAALRWELMRSALGSFDVVVADLGPWPQGKPIVDHASAAILVCDATPTGMVRAASVAEQWSGPTPLLIVNRAGQADVTMARRAVGLEPSGVVPPLECVRSASGRSEGPPEALLDLIAPIRRTLLK
jgi:hypothetical protein